MCQEIGLDRHPGAFSLSDSLAQAHGVPVNDDRGQQIELSTAERLCAKAAAQSCLSGVDVSLSG